MGIRYYAYAFDAEQTERALADPRSMLSADPLADAWGLEPGSTSGVTNFEQVVPERDMLYLDKAWSLLQGVTGSGDGATAPRPAYRMFEGHVTQDGQWGWQAWVRALTPDEVAEVARDLAGLDDKEVREQLFASAPAYREPAAEADYGLHYLQRAREFAIGLAADGRGMVYLIG